MVGAFPDSVFDFCSVFGDGERVAPPAEWVLVQVVQVVCGFNEVFVVVHGVW